MCNSIFNLSNYLADFAVLIKDQVGSNSTIVNKPPVEDDPQQRRPVIKLAKDVSFNETF